MDSSWSSLISLEPLGVTNTPLDLPGLDSCPSPKRARISESQLGEAMPREPASVYGEKAEKVKTYQPGTVLVQPPERRPPEPEHDRLMFIPDLDQDITHRDVFTYFSKFGDLERVSVRNGMSNFNYAMVRFSRTSYMEHAIESNPHLIKGYRLNCRKAKEKSTNKGSQQNSGTIKKPKATITQPHKAPVRQAEKNDAKPSGHKSLEKNSKPPINRSLLLQKLVEPTSYSPFTAVKSDRNYAYALTKDIGISRWSFNLLKFEPSSDEVRALEKGLSSSAKLLLSIRKKLAAVPHKSVEPPAPKWLQAPSDKVGSNVTSKVAPPIPASSPVLPSLPQTPSDKAVPKVIFKIPPPPPASSPVLPSLPSLLPITPLVPKPKPVLRKISKSDLRYAVLASLGQNYVHHCYTNVAAYRRTKNYVDLQLSEMKDRPSISMFVDQMYAQKE
uniref:IP11883p n=1 Tax=Drosophila melanogaster TaxID=7227 RepID=A8E6P8_DROME|nr:IP11883p [Drosophila melanogaster]